MADQPPQDLESETQRIQVSNVKKPLFFYVNLAKVSDRCVSRSCGDARLGLEADHDQYVLPTVSRLTDTLAQRLLAQKATLEFAAVGLGKLDVNTSGLYPYHLLTCKNKSYFHPCNYCRNTQE